MIKLQHKLNDEGSPNGVYYLPDLTCPKCRQPATGAGSIQSPGEQIKPSAGDLTICVYCETISKYATGPRGWRLLKLSSKQLRQMDPENREQFEMVKPYLAKVWGPLGSRRPAPEH